jgi:DNA repair exonuclease SbcCD ATPase subunit
MYRFSLLAVLLAAPAAFGQTSSTDSQTLQALLSEVRQLRQELETYSATTQRTQILFFRLQSQQAATARASGRADDARTKLSETQTARNKAETEAKGVHDSLEHTDNPVERKNLEDMAAYYKHRLGELADEEQQRQSKQIETEDQLRLEQAKLSDLQARLDELERALQKSNPRRD